MSFYAETIFIPRHGEDTKEMEVFLERNSISMEESIPTPFNVVTNVGALSWFLGDK